LPTRACRPSAPSVLARPRWCWAALVPGGAGAGRRRCQVVVPIGAGRPKLCRASPRGSRCASGRVVSLSGDRPMRPRAIRMTTELRGTRAFHAGIRRCWWMLPPSDGSSRSISASSPDRGMHHAAPRHGPELVTLRARVVWMRWKPTSAC
jgi:hypothetical protein